MMYIRKIHIERVRHLSDIDIPLGDDGHPRHLILTGKNGSGKTSVLDAMSGYIDSVCRGKCPSKFEVHRKVFLEELTRLERNPEENKESMSADSLEALKNLF